MNAEAKPSVGARVLEELRKYGLVSAYLYVCFAVLLLYKAAMLGSDSAQALPHGLALVKALILGKFILIGEAVGTGARADRHALLYRIAWKSVAYLLVLLIFSAIEEIIVGWVHGKTIAAVAAEYLDRSWVENVAPSLVMLLILIPLVSITEINRVLGTERFKELLLK